MRTPIRKRPHARLVVREHAPWRHWLVVGGSSAFIALVAFAIYTYSVSRMPYEWERVEVEKARLEIEKSRLQERIREMRAENAHQAEQIVLLERSRDIDGEATKDLREALDGQQRELSALKEQLAFYRGIVSPEQSKAGVRIYQVALHRDARNPQLYGYDLVLIQSLRHDRTVSGRVRIEVQGINAGRQTTLPLEQLSLASQNALTFNFKYFQQLAGSFQLPEGFAPRSVRVVLESDTDARVEGSYKWNDVFQISGEG